MARTAAAARTNAATRTTAVTRTGLVKNGNFEKSPGTTATTTEGKWLDGTAGGNANDVGYDWYGKYISGTGSSAGFQTSTVNTGTSALKLVLAANGAYTQVQTGTNSDAKTKWSILLKPNTSYTLTAWVAADNVTGSSNHGGFVALYESNGTALITGQATTYVKANQDFTKYTKTFTTNASTICGNILVCAWGHTGTATLQGNFYFDDITLQQTSRSAVA